MGNCAFQIAGALYWLKGVFMETKKYGIWDNLHSSWFFFSLNGNDGKEKYDFFNTKREAEEAINFCRMAFFNQTHDFIVKEYVEETSAEKEKLEELKNRL